jgi:hypothetical protein
MKALSLTAAALVTLLSASNVMAGEFHRHTTIYGPAGVTTGYTDRVCYDITCTYNHQVTGPYGNSMSRTATTTEVAPDVYSRSATVTGPRGASATRSSTLTINR